jgi:pilus assembly protein Flp/PilA
MNVLIRVANELLEDESGATAIEYSLVAALIALVIIGAVTMIGNTFNDTFGMVAGELAPAPQQ